MFYFFSFFPPLKGILLKNEGDYKNRQKKSVEAKARRRKVEIYFKIIFFPLEEAAGE